MLTLLTLLSGLAWGVDLSERSVGIGVGTSFGTSGGAVSSGTPDTVIHLGPVIDQASVRFQVGERTVLEPMGSFVVGGTRQDEVRRNTTSGSAALGLRWLAASKDIVHLVGLASIGVATARSGGREDEADLQVDRTTTGSVSAGLGVELTPSVRWSLSADVRNALVSYSRSVRVPPEGDAVVGSNYSVGLRFQPAVAVMGHLWF